MEYLKWSQKYSNKYVTHAINAYNSYHEGIYAARISVQKIGESPYQ